MDKEKSILWEPTSFAVGQTILEEKGTVAKELSAVRTVETFRMEMFPNSIQAILK